MECNIDDMNAEFYDNTMQKLFSEGALDVFMTSIMMKKNRPGVKLSVIAKKQDADKLSLVIFSETTTIGIRRYPVERQVLERKIHQVDTKYGVIRVKAAYMEGSIMNYAPEYEDVKNAGLESGVPLKKIYNEALNAFFNKYI